MKITNRRSGTSLVLTGLLGVLYFWITDSRFGLTSRWSGSPISVDEANQAFVGSVVGVAGSLVVVGIGIWLLTRRPT